MRLASLQRRLLGGLALAVAAVSPVAHAGEKFVFLTDWFAQAEHGGFYQAQALGLYKQAGLDLTLRMGGPQVNLVQLLAAGQADCIMGFDVQTMKAWEQGVQAVTVAAFAQKDPLVLIAHPDVQRLEDLKDRTLLIGQAGQVTYWPWLKARYGFHDKQVRPYTFNIQPFLADKRIAQQGYLTSEPYSIEKASGIKPKVFLMADQGWPPYAGSVVCLQRSVEQRPQAITAFLKASAEGWKRYLQGDPAPANALIKRDNPNMTDDVIAQSIALLKAHGIVLGGDAAVHGIGTITDARMKRTFDMLVQHKLIDPSKVDWRQTYTTRLIQPVQVKP
jgi:NitT/TauT family transport system substrate-binding protein